MVLKPIEDVLLLVGVQVGLEKPDAFNVMLRFYLTSQKKGNPLRPMLRSR